MSIIVKSSIKKLVKEIDRENNLSSVAEEVGVALEKKVENLLGEAIKRAKANNRRTVMSKDI